MSAAMLVFQTQSEQDFFDFCQRQNWAATKLSESKVPRIRTPDFLVRTATAYEFIVEVTEFESEPPLNHGQFAGRGHTLGNPLRAKLAEKKGQVRDYSPHMPTLIVISAGFDYLSELEPISFDSALYGEMAVTISVPNDPRRTPERSDEMHNAGRRFFGPKHNRSVSAVAALNGRPQVLRIYHNKFATQPLDPARTVIGTTNIEHFVKPDGGLSGWEKVF